MSSHVTNNFRFCTTESCLLIYRNKNQRENIYSKCIIKLKYICTKQKLKYKGKEKTLSKSKNKALLLFYFK